MNERKESTTSIILEYVKSFVLSNYCNFYIFTVCANIRVNGSSMENAYFQ